MIINHLLNYTILIVFILHCTFAKEYDGDCKKIKTIIDSYENYELKDCTNDDNEKVVSM